MCVCVTADLLTAEVTRLPKKGREAKLAALKISTDLPWKSSEHKELSTAGSPKPRHGVYFNNTTIVLKVSLSGTKANARVCVYFGYLPFSHPLFDQFGSPTVAHCAHARK